MDGGLGIFDVADAILSGKVNTRKLYHQAPEDGAEAVPPKRERHAYQETLQTCIGRYEILEAELLEICPNYCSQIDHEVLSFFQGIGIKPHHYPKLLEKYDGRLPATQQELSDFCSHNSKCILKSQRKFSQSSCLPSSFQADRSHESGSGDRRTG